MKTVLLLLLPFTAFTQCPSDICEDAFNVTEQTPEAFCNYDCNEDFSQPWDGWNFSQFPCQYLNYDQWYTIEVTEGGMVQFHIESDYNTPEEIGEDGEYEGVVMDIWQGDDCDNIEFLWGTNCYWMTDEVYYINPSEYNPSRLEWDFTIELEPGTYYINIDGFGYSVGCGEWWWSEPFFLWLGIDGEIHKLRKQHPNLFNVLGQKIK